MKTIIWVILSLGDGMSFPNLLTVPPDLGSEDAVFGQKNLKPKTFLSWDPRSQMEKERELIIVTEMFAAPFFQAAAAWMFPSPTQGETNGYQNMSWQTANHPPQGQMWRQKKLGGETGRNWMARLDLRMINWDFPGAPVAM